MSRAYWQKQKDGSYVLDADKCFPGTSVVIVPCKEGSTRYRIKMVNLETGQESYYTRDVAMHGSNIGVTLKPHFSKGVAMKYGRECTVSETWLLRVGIDGGYALNRAKMWHPGASLSDEGGLTEWREM